MDASTPLRPAAEVVIEFDASGETGYLVGGRRVPAGRHGAHILDVFRPGLSVDRGLRRLAARSATAAEWMRLADVVHRAVAAGVLVPARGPRPGARGFARPAAHLAMVRDEGRTRAFCAAVARTVRPGDVVLDIGTGSGILAVAAAQAGARRVFAVEVTDMADVAERVAEVNGFAGVVEVVRGWSTEVELPELADVLVTETIGDDPLGEDLLPIVADAAARLLRPRARLIPRSLDLWAWPLEVPRSEYERHVTTGALVDRWGAELGIDLSPLAEAGAAPWCRSWPAATTGSWRRLGSGVRIASFALPPSRTDLDVTGELPVTADGELGAVTVGFHASLADGIDLAVGPGTPGTSWCPVTWHLAEPLPVRAGDRLAVQASRAASLALDVSVLPGTARYRLAGLTLASTLPLRDLEAQIRGSDADVDVDVRAGVIGEPSPAAPAGRRAQVGPDEVVLDAGAGRVQVREGKEIVVDGDLLDDEVQLTVLGAGLAALVLQRGILPLHASTVVGPQGAVAFSGGRGAGKTTVCASLDRDGLTLLADDLTPVRVVGGAVTALAAVRRFKLRRDTLRDLGLDLARHRPLRMDGELKWPVPAWSPPPAGDGVELHAVVLLAPDGTVTEPVVERLEGAGAVAAVAGACFRPRWRVEPAIDRLVASASLAVAAAVPVLRLRRPVDPAALRATLEVARRLVSGEQAQEG